MWTAGAGFALHADSERAAREAAEQAAAAAGGADAALLFAGPRHRADAKRLLASACAALGIRRGVGGTAHGGIRVGREDEGGSGGGVPAIRGLEAEPLWLPALAGNEDAAAGEIAALLDGGGRPEDLVVLIPDPRALQPDPLLERVRGAVGSAAVVGAGAGD